MGSEFRLPKGHPDTHRLVSNMTSEKSKLPCSEHPVQEGSGHLGQPRESEGTSGDRPIPGTLVGCVEPPYTESMRSLWTDEVVLAPTLTCALSYRLETCTQCFQG